MQDEPTTSQASDQPKTVEKMPAKLAENIVEKDGSFFIRTVVNQVEKLVPFDEVRIAMQKEMAGDAKLAEAAEARKSTETLAAEHKTAIEFWELNAKAMAGDQDAAAQALALLPGDYQPPVNTGDGNNTGNPAPFSMDNLPEELKEVVALGAWAKKNGVDLTKALGFVQNQAVENLRSSLSTEVGKAAQSDPAIAGLPEGPAAEFKADLEAKVEQLVGQGLQQGPATFAMAIREIKAKYDRMGIFTASQTPSAQPKTAIEHFNASLGPATGGVSGNDLLPSKPPEGITPIGTPADQYAENVKARWAYWAAEKAQRQEVGVG